MAIEIVDPIRNRCLSYGGGQVGTMKKTANWRRRLVLTVIICSASVLLAFAFGNFFPDPTWRAVNAARKIYAGIVSRLTPLPTGADRAVQEENIHEAIFREMVGPKGPRGHLFFLKIGGNDPTDEFMARFSAWDPAPMKASKATFDLSQGYTDRATGRHGGGMLSVGSIKWLFGDRVEVDGGFVCGGLCGSGGVYQLVKRHGRWVVETYVKRWDA